LSSWISLLLSSEIAFHGEPIMSILYKLRKYLNV
jgi:hypothetical protein